MFGTIRRHQQWLWMIIITVIIISFVVFYTDTPSLPSGNVDLGSINGRTLTREDFINARKEEMFDFRLSQRRWPSAEDANRNFDQQIRQRLYFVAKIREANIEVSDEAVAHYMANVFRGTNGAYSERIYADFVNDLKQNGLTEDDMFRFFRNQVGLNQLVSSVGLSGKLLSPRVAEAYYQRENEQIAGGVAFFSVSNYLSQADIETNKLVQYYNQRTNSSYYWTPKKIAVSHVAFAVTNYLAEADKVIALETNLDFRVDQVYLAGLQARNADGSTNRYKDLAEAAAKELIRKEYRHQHALRVAYSNAVQFANAVYSLSPLSVTNMAAHAARNGLAVRDTEPFAEQEGAAGFPADDGKEVAQAAFKLTEEQPVLGQLVTTTNAVYILGLKSTVWSRPQTFEEVRTRVIDEVRRRDAMEKMREAGMALEEKLNAGLSNQTFKAICDAAKVSAVELPLFSADSPMPALEGRISTRELVQISSQVKTGKISGYMPRGSGGIIMYVRERKPPVDTAIKLASVLENLREGRQNAAFQAWFMEGYGKSGLAPRPEGGKAGSPLPE